MVTPILSPQPRPGNVADLLDAALDYHSRGWSIIPVRKKKAAFEWKGFQEKPPAEALLHDWFSGRFKGISGVAVIAGPVSRGLTCRDFDRANGYFRWAKDHPKLAGVLPTAQTGRGFHVYFRSKADHVLKLDDGELRGNGLCVLPPSLHPSGASYRWTVSLPAESLPFLDPRKVGLLLCNTEDSEDTEESENTEKAEQPHESSVLHATSAVTTDPAGSAVLATLPSGMGQRHYALFTLARRLKALPHLADANLGDLKPLVRRWHQLALPVIGTKPFEESWIDFAEGWQRVRFPAGAGPLEALWLQAMAEAPPVAALAYEQDGVRRLVAFCYQLQRHAGQAAFFLACRTAGTLLGVEHTTAWRWLRLMEIDGVLARVSTGSQKTQKANEYYYKGEGRA